MTGDFNRFNVDEADFAEINRRVLAHQAVVGNADVFAGTHTCLPAVRRFPLDAKEGL